MKKRVDISIVNGHLIDPGNGIDQPQDVHISRGKILAIGAKPDDFEAELVIDARGQIVCPGLVDLNSRLREPGHEHKATIASETAAAASAGITTLLCQPDTQPVTDTTAVVELIRRQWKNAGKARVIPLAAMTQNLAGTEISEMHALQKAGCVAVSNAGKPLNNTLVQRRAMEYAATFGLQVFIKSEDRHLRNQGCVHEGAVASRLGLPAYPEAAETVAVARDITLAEATGACLHFQTLSTANSLRKIEHAISDGIALSADVAAHQLHLTEMDIDGFNANCHVDPPLRTLRDRDALRAAVASGLISAICSDHQPHDRDAKAHPFPDSEAGISALETLLPLTLKLVTEGIIDMSTAIARLTCGPADIAGLPYGRLTPGLSADVCIFNADSVWQFEADRMLSKGKNTPFDGWEFAQRVTHTIFEGRLVYQADSE